MERTRKPAAGTYVTPAEYIAAIDEPRRSQVQQVYDLIAAAVPDQEPYIGYGMIAFGRFHYKYASGREGDWAPVALASQKQYISVYVSAADAEGYLAERFKARLPKASIGKSCIRFKRTDDIDLTVLAECVREGVTLQMGGR